MMPLCVEARLGGNEHSEQSQSSVGGQLLPRKGALGLSGTDQAPWLMQLQRRTSYSDPHRPERRRPHVIDRTTSTTIVCEEVWSGCRAASGGGHRVNERPM